MKEFTATIVPSVKEQRSRHRKYIIDPELARAPSASEYPLMVFRNGDFRQMVGLVNNVRLDKGRLVADFRIREEELVDHPRFEASGTAGRLGGHWSIVSIASIHKQG